MGFGEDGGGVRNARKRWRWRWPQYRKAKKGPPSSGTQESPQHAAQHEGEETRLGYHCRYAGWGDKFVVNGRGPLCVWIWI